MSEDEAFADPPDITPPRDPVGDIIRAELNAATPPDHTIDPADVDEDEHPTCAWTVGERLDPDVLERLQGIIRGED